MKLGNSSNRLSMKIISGLTYFFTIILFVVTAFLQIILPREKDLYEDRVCLYPGKWEWVHDNQREEITLPASVDVPWGETMVVETTIPSDVTDSKCIYFRGSQQTVYAYVDGEQRGVHDTKNTRLLGKNSNSASIFIKLKASDAGKTLRIELSSKSLFSGKMKLAYYGDKFDIWYMLLKQNLPETVLDSFVLVFGIMLIILALYLRVKKKNSKSIELLGIITLLNAFFCISDIHIRDLIFSNTSNIGDTTYFAGILLFQTMIYYIDYNQNYKYHKIYRIFEVINIIMFPLSLIFVLLGLVEPYNLIYFILFVVVAFYSVFIFYVIYDIKRKQIKEYIFVAVGAIWYFVCISIGLLLSNMFMVIESWGLFISIGIVFLSFNTLQKTFFEMMDAENEKKKALYEKEVKDRFFAMVSHELRTPINSVIGMNELIIHKSNDEEILKYAINANSSGKILLSLVNDLLDFSRMQSGELKIIEQPYDTKSMITNSSELVKETAAKKNLKFSVVVDKNIPSKLDGDEIRIKQIITNLLSNAIKYTAEGEITLEIQCERDAGNAVMTIMVKDTGQGIKSENINHLFDSFSRFEEKTNKYIEGTGLGLSITKSLVDRMHGTINVESEYGKGSTFTVKIVQRIIDDTPIGEFDINQIQLEHQKKDISVRNTCKEILIVDDNEMNRFILIELLKEMQLSVTEAVNGQDAAEKARNKKYDIILMDHLMPVMDGVESTKEIRKKDSKSKDSVIIALTANAYVGIREEYISMGFNDYLSKPIEIEKLMELFHKYIEE